MNKTHPIVSQLLKLRESSREAVADSLTQNPDTLKKYLHITRQVEDRLADIIKNTNEHDSKLILVCGNVGDGKSHTLAEVTKREGLEDKINLFRIHNDATESFSHDKGCIETLNDVLHPFSDAELEESNAKLIIAINLGTLSNFLEEYGNSYQKLSEYVGLNSIIEDTSNILESESTTFSHINFADHHLFNLTQFGADPYVINKLLDKISADSEENPIYQAYKEVLKSEWGSNCIIKKNYEFLFSKIQRGLIANLLTQLAVEYKFIISIRQLLNFVFDIIVPPSIANISFDKYQKFITKGGIEYKVTNYLPFHIFENSSLSKIFGGLSLIDPCNKRIEQLDEKLVLLHTSYEGKAFLEKLMELFNIKSEEVEKISLTTLSKFYIRHLFFYKNPMFKDKTLYPDFLDALYWNNIKDHIKQKPHHKYIKNAIYRWNGNTNSTDKVMLRMDSPQNKYRVFKDLNLSICPPPKDSVKKEVPGALDRFSLELYYEFETLSGPKSIYIDFSLYSLLRRINDGYRPNKMDRNNYVQFAMFVDKLTLSNSDSCQLYIDEVNVGNKIDFIVKLNDYQEITFEKVN